MKFGARMKAIMVGGIALFILLALGLSRDVMDLIREREQRGQKVYTTNRLTLSLPELSSQGATKANILALLEAEESDDEIEELKAALNGAVFAERTLDFRLVSSELVDIKKQNEFIERSSQLVFTGLEYNGRKLLQHEAENKDEANSLIAGLRSAIAETDSSWDVLIKLQGGANALYDQLKSQGPIYTINDAGVVQLVEAEATLIQALTDNFSTVALLTSEFYSKLEVGNSLEAANQHLQSALLELDRQEGPDLYFNLLREFQPEVDSREYFLAIGWNELNRLRLIRTIPVSLSDTDERVEVCDNGADDDSNGQVDCDDSACSSNPNCMHVDPELDCFNGMDDDGNGYTDCDDQFCQNMGVCTTPTDSPTSIPTESPTATPTTPSFEVSCDDAVDNDADGMTDCGDWDCNSHWSCYWNPPLDCSSSAPLCPDGQTTCSDGYDAGGWCYYPCENCNRYNIPPAAPTISTPQAGWLIGSCDGGFEVSGYADGADYVEVFIDGSYAGSASVYGGQWQTWIYTSSGTRSIYAVAASYTNGRSENSWEFQFSFETSCEPPFQPAEFVGLSEPATLNVDCASGAVQVSVQVPEYLDSLRLSYEGGEVATLWGVYPGEQQLQAWLPGPTSLHLTLTSYAYNQTISREQVVFVQSECVGVPVCGNGSVESGEQCDDGNNSYGDGCSSSCSIEGQPTVVETPVPTVNPTVVPTVQPTVQPTVKPTDSPTDSPTAQPTETTKCGNGKVEDDEECESPVENGWCDADCVIQCDKGYIARKTIWPFDGNRHVCSGYTVNENACGESNGECNNGHPFDYDYRPPYGERTWKCGSTICYPRQ